MMMKRSSGVLVYKIEQNQLKVLLCHMGGPYWQNIDEGAWSIPKGEMSNEKAISAATREFQEETGFTVDYQNLEFLGSKKQSSNKLVIIFCTTGDYDSTKATSNTFSKEWPKGSGKIQQFPEMDRAEWLDITVAKKKILQGQVYFLNKLERKLKKVNDKVIV